jgi:Leucine-rich repeat (LRR) protein
VDNDELARGLAHCTALKELQLIHCNISDLTFFASSTLPHLERLYLTENDFSTLEPLRKLFTSRGPEMKEFMMFRTAHLADISCLIDTVHCWKKCTCISISLCKVPPAQAAHFLTEVAMHCNEIRNFCFANSFSAADIKDALRERGADITDELSQTICRNESTAYLKVIKEQCGSATDSPSAAVGMKRKISE